jgi:hypothetical protein
MQRVKDLYVLGSVPADPGAKADKLADKRPIMSAASKARSSRALRRARGATGVMAEAVCGGSSLGCIMG